MTRTKEKKKKSPALRKEIKYMGKCKSEVIFHKAFFSVCHFVVKLFNKNKNKNKIQEAMRIIGEEKCP